MKKLILKDETFTHEELQDIWSALSVWDKHLDKKANPQTAKAIKKLILKVRKNIGHKV